MSSYVTVNWTGSFAAKPFDWIAAYSPPPATLDGYLTTLPVKYFNLTAEQTSGVTSGSLSMWLLHMRAPWILVYMRGGIDSPTVVALSNIIEYADGLANVPMQIHLTRTADPTEMQVTWITTNASTPVALWSLEGQPSSKVAANTSTYTREQMCGGLAATIGWRDPGLIHTAVMTGLQAGAQYSYAVGDAESNVFSASLSFFAPPAPATDIDFIIYGDQGQAEFDGSIEWAEMPIVEGQMRIDIDQPASINTSYSVTADLTDGSVNVSTALVLIIGDVSYARGREAMWDQHSYLLEPFATQVAVNTLLGNHEIDWTDGPYWPGTDSGGECGVAIQARYPMPSPPSRLRDEARARGAGFTDTPWYSFNHGAVHFVMMSSEHDFTTNSEQWKWIEADLAAVDREATPWVLMSSHRPMYVSSPDFNEPDGDMPVAALLRLHVEPLLQQYKVDAFFAGHHHDFQRTCAVFNQTCADRPSRQSATQQTDVGRDDADDAQKSPREVLPSFGTVHTVTGAAGQWCNVYLDPSPLDWLDVANTQVHGYTRARVRGSELTLEFVASNDREVWDSITITKGGQGRPPVITQKPSRGNLRTNKGRPHVLPPTPLMPTQLE